MLISLTIQDFVIVDRLHLDFKSGFSVLTGETGAGKSILLDAIGLALGERATAKFVRANCAQAVIIATFEIEDSKNDQLASLWEEHGLQLEETLIVRRIVTADGKSRCYLNDQPISVTLLKQIAPYLVDIHGQFDQLLEPKSHQSALDKFGALQKSVDVCRENYHAWKEVLKKYAQLEQQLTNTRNNREYLEHVIKELDELAPLENEEAALVEERVCLANQSKIMEALQTAFQALTGEQGILDKCNTSFRALDRQRESALGQFDELIQTFDRLGVEAQEALSQIGDIENRLQANPHRLAEIEERLFALRSLARKHNCLVDYLPTLHADLQEQLDTLKNGAQTLAELKNQSDTLRQTYLAQAKELVSQRREKASELDALVASELPPLKMGAAIFKTSVDEMEESAWNEFGVDRTQFIVQTNPGSQAGPLKEIASGGERARLMLALKVILAQSARLPTIIFDEIDSGVGGAVASAIGERLRKLSKHSQVLIVTHSPQVAACADFHYRVEKVVVGEGTSSTVVLLTDTERQEEIARMLSGSHVTEQARAAAHQLLNTSLKAA